MVKYYKYLAKQLLTYLLLLRYDKGNLKPKEVCLDGDINEELEGMLVINRNNYDEGFLGQIAEENLTERDMLGNRYPMDEQQVDLDEMIKLTHNMIHQEQDDGALINAIVDALKGPYARSALTGPVLDRLRKALLLPEEIMQLKAMLKQRGLRCASCGHTLRVGEMAVITQGTDGGMEVFCTVCMMPRFMRCIECADGVLALTKSLVNAIGKALCSGCKSKNKAIDLNVPPPLPEVERADQPDIYRTVFNTAPVINWETADTNRIMYQNAPATGWNVIQADEGIQRTPAGGINFNNEPTVPGPTGIRTLGDWVRDNTPQEATPTIHAINDENFRDDGPF